jgi:outer membrane autotransporter protein
VAIYFGAADATLNLLAGTAVQGPIVFSGGGNTVTFGPALNAVMSFAGSGLPQTVLTGGRPFVTSGGSVAVVDITGFASSAPLVEDLADGIGGVTEARMSSQSGDLLVPRNGRETWASTFGGVRSQAGSGASAGFGETLGGVVAGVESRSGDGFLGGVLLGGAAGSTEVDDEAQEIAHRSVFAGGYLGYDGGAHFAGATLVAGVLQEQSRRRLANNLVAGGVETARADFNSVFLSPSVALGTRLPVSAGTLIPSVRLRYVGLFVGDYAENGSGGDLAVKRRDVKVFEARGQLALALAPVGTPSQTWQTTLRAGIDAIAQNSDELSATLLGQDLTFGAGGKKVVVRGFAGADIAAAVGVGMTLNAGFEAGYGSDNAFTVRGMARLSKAF